MLMRTIAAIALGILLGGLTYVAGNVSADAPPAAHAADAAACTRLSSLKLPDATITSAQVVSTGSFKPSSGAAEGFADLPSFCRVELTIKPSPDSDIKSETWLPLAGWNGKFQEVGNGGWNGFIQYAALAAALRKGYATASTDTGHAGDTASFAPGHP
jgi:feruloyl esterase